MGAFDGYAENAAAMLGVISKHRAAVGNIQHADSVPADLLSAARKSWDDALDIGEGYGFRNAQATVLAPTGTISFMMDCDTTGVEPDFSLVKSKKLVGGGEITIVNKTVPMALSELGYAPGESDEIVAYIDERNTVVGTPYLKAEHYPVFDCAIGERAIHYMGHVKMMGAVQPFVSGAISKTVNLPEQTTVDEVGQLLIEAWRLGVKAIAIYRDNCKVAQPLSGSKDKSEGALVAGALSAVGVIPHALPPHPVRRRLPDDRVEVGRKFRVGEYEGYIHVGLFDDGTPGDIFVDIAKEGTTLAGLMNSFMISVSLGLQYGVPLEVYVSKFSHMRFEPSGLTNDPDIRAAKSLVDYIFRWMGKKFLSADQQEEAGILTPEVKAAMAARYAARRPPRRRSWSRRRRVRPRSSTASRTRSSVRSAAVAWSGRARATRAATAARTPAAADPGRQPLGTRLPSGVRGRLAPGGLRGPARQQWTLPSTRCKWVTTCNCRRDPSTRHAELLRRRARFFGKDAPSPARALKEIHAVTPVAATRLDARRSRLRRRCPSSRP